MLDKVRSFEKQQEILNILHSEDPCHYERLYMVGFLQHVGYSLQEICDIIDQENSWSDYDTIMTYNQVRSIFKVDISSQVSFPQPFLSSKEKAYIENKTYCTIVYTSCSKCHNKCSI